VFPEYEIGYIALEKNYPSLGMGNQEAHALSADQYGTCGSPYGSHKIFAPTTRNERQGG